MVAAAELDDDVGVGRRHGHELQVGVVGPDLEGASQLAQRRLVAAQLGRPVGQASNDCQQLATATEDAVPGHGSLTST